MKNWKSRKVDPYSHRYDGKIYFGEYSYYLSIIPRRMFTEAMAEGNCYIDTASVSYIFVVHGFADTLQNRSFLLEFLDDGHVYYTRFITDSKGRVKESERKNL